MADDETFKKMIAYFWEEKGDPTRYVDWDAMRCSALLPEFYEMWTKYKVYRELADVSLNRARDIR